MSRQVRVDPYWDALWESGRAQVAWVSADSARRRAQWGESLPGRWRVGEDEAWERLSSPQHWDAVVDALGAVNQWRTMTVAQLAELTGRRLLGSLNKNGDSLVAALFAVGLIDFGVSLAPMSRNVSPPPGAVLLRPSSSRVFEQRVAPMLTYPEWLRVTGGVGFAPGRQADRHNVLAVELALRAAEHGEVGAALGELVASTDLLAYSGLGRVKPPGLQSAADAVLVRSDGLRVAVEITASVGDRFKKKVTSWARTLADTTLAHSGLVVVFVDASDPTHGAGVKKGLLSEIRYAVKGASRRHPGSAGDRVAERMGVVSWRQLFPARGEVSDALPVLTAWCPSGDGDDVWQSRDFLDPLGFELPDGAGVDLGAVTGNARLLAGNPVACERRYEVSAPVVARSQLAVAGFEQLPVPSTVRSDRRDRVDGPRGVVGAATVPHRLLGVRGRVLGNR